VWLSALPDATVVALGAEDPARCRDLPAMKHAALSHGQAPVVPCTHCAELAVNASLLPFQAKALSRCEAAASHSIANASLLVELTLHNRIFGLFRRGGLCKRHGGRCSECRHKYKLEESHGVSPSVTAVADIAPGHSHFLKHHACKFVV
jgi:hypothetical protein